MELVGESWLWSRSRCKHRISLGLSVGFHQPQLVAVQQLSVRGVLLAQLHHGIDGWRACRAHIL